jgi:acetate kinase
MPEDGERRILAINSGSSSLKTSLYRIGNTEELLVSSEVRRIGLPGSRIRTVNGQGKTLLDRCMDFPEPSAALKATLEWFQQEHHTFDAIGHRVVHGGPRYTKPQLVTPELLAAMRQLTPIDPDHLPQAIAAIELARETHPSLPQVACFDTAFHRRMPRVAQLCPLPAHYYDEGVMRYGFHGLSYEYVMSELRRLDGGMAKGRIVIAHLGSGASMVAVLNGESLDTTMGFTPTAGLAMGTRSGDVDPGVLLFLLQQKKMTAGAVNDLLNRQSGLLGISGLSADMQDLLACEQSDPRAALAVDFFCLRAKKYLGAYAALLGGLDMVVFTGGIGEHAYLIRERICSGLDFLGIEIDRTRNQQNALTISTTNSQVTVRVIKTNEELVIARHSAAVI